MFIKGKEQHQNQPQHKFPDHVPITQERTEEGTMNWHSNVRNTNSPAKNLLLRKDTPNTLSLNVIWICFRTICEVRKGILVIALSASSTVPPSHLPSYWRGMVIILNTSLQYCHSPCLDVQHWGHCHEMLSIQKGGKTVFYELFIKYKYFMSSYELNM